MAMRGRRDGQGRMFFTINVEQRIAAPDAEPGARRQVAEGPLHEQVRAALEAQVLQVEDGVGQGR